MPWFAAAAAAGAALALAGKLVSRHARGLIGRRAVEDPPGMRTVVRFVIHAPVERLGTDPRAPDQVLLAVAAELARDFDDPLELTADAVRTRPRPNAGPVDLVRLARRRVAPPTYTLELTRAWTGIHLDDDARRLLVRIHEALSTSPIVREVAWFARQDRAFVSGDPFPYDAQPSVQQR